MKKVFLLLMSLSLLSSCEQELKGPIVSVNIVVAIKNSSGQNLLDEKTDGYLKAEDIQMVFMEGDKESNFSISPSRKSIVKNADGEMLLNIEPNIEGSKTTVLKFKDNTKDVIVVRVKKPKPVDEIIDKIWLNGVVVYDEDNLQQGQIVGVRRIELVK